MKTNNIILAVLIVSLFGCQPNNSLRDEIVGGDRLIQKEEMFDRDQFIEESAERNAKAVQYGPQALTDKEKEAELRKSYRQLINKEEAPNYTKLKENKKLPTFPVSINVENMEIRLFAQLMSKITGMNLLISDEVQGDVNAKLIDVNWTSVLDSVLQIKSLAQNVDDKAKIIRIHSQGKIVQLEDFERNRQSALQRTVMIERSNEPMYTEIFKLFYTEPEIVKTMIEGVLGLSDSGNSNNSGMRDTTAKITTDPRMNQLIIKARKNDMQVISKVIDKIDARTNQIMIEAFIVEVDDDFERQFGARLGLQGSDTFVNNGNTFNGQVIGVGSGTGAIAPGTGDSTISNLAASTPFGGIGFLAGIGGAANLKLELTAMEREGLSKVISNPRIFTLDNQEAVIFQGVEIPYQTVSDSGTQIEFKEAGLKLSVTPTIVGDGNVVLRVKVNKDTADTSQPNPPITKSEIITNLITKDGAVVVIGGIYTETDAGGNDKVPGIGDVPGVGKLFRREVRSENRKELMIFMAPKVM